MPGRAPYLLRWSPQKQTYEISAKDTPAPPHLAPDTPAWFAWLDNITSFSFYSRTGAYCTVRKETIRSSGTYWYGYRSVQRRTVKHYIGRTADLFIARLEQCAERFTEVSPVARQQFEQGTDEHAPAQHSPAKSSETVLPPLLAARLHPPRLPSGLIERPQLFTRLDAWQSYKLTLLCAPAGFGKTTLVNSWLTQRNMLSEVAWISLDTSDNDPVHFWRSVLIACKADPDQYIFPPLFPSALSSLQPLSLKDTLISFLNTATTSDQHHLLILDDYQVICEPEIHKTLNFCLAHLPETLHIVLMTRSELPLSLGRLRAGGEVNEIQTADLRFSHEESVAFLQHALAFPLSTELWEPLGAHLEGWIAGLRLLSLSLQPQISQEQIEHLLATFRGSHRSIRDYLVAEVLHAQPEELQDFLLRTSVLPRLSASLCAAVTGRQESRAFLETIERANLFLEPLDGSGEWYRYHTPFAEAMQAEALRRLGEQNLLQISHAASCWFEEHGLLFDAIETALKTEENSRAAALIEQYIETAHLQKLPEYNTLHRWLQQLPETTLTHYPLLCLHYALTLIFCRGEHRWDQTFARQIARLLQRAEDNWRTSNNLIGQGQILAFRAFFTYQQGEHKQALIYARQALAWLPATEPLWRVMGLGTLGIEALQEGQFNEARRIFQEMHTLWQPSGDPHILEGIILMLGIICQEQGDLHQAARYFRTLLSESKLREDHPASIAAQLCLSQVHYEWNDLDTTQQLLQEVLDLQKQLTAMPPEVLQMPLELGLARLQYARGETTLAIQRLTALLPLLRSYITTNGFFLYFYQEALQMLIQCSFASEDHVIVQEWVYDIPPQEDLYRVLAPDTPLLIAPDDQQPEEPIQPDSPLPAQSDLKAPFIFQEQRTLLQVRLSLAQGDVEAALNTLNNLLPAARATGRRRYMLQIELLMAQAYAARSQKSEAHQLLLEALKQGYASNHQRIFVDEGEKLSHLLRDLLPSLRNPLLRNYVQTLLHASIGPQDSQPTVITPSVATPFEPLSPQEQRVLRLLAAGRSNIEIARELIVSVNTIRSQVQSIYRKLQVNNRHAATTIARDLHLL